jgi:hypothetical protein
MSELKPTHNYHSDIFYRLNKVRLQIFGFDRSEMPSRNKYPIDSRAGNDSKS